MIQLYPKGTTDFTKNGIELAPAESEVNWQIAGRYDFTMNIPREKVAGITLDYGQIMKVSVPPEHVDAISLGTVSYYTVSASNGTPLYSRVPSAVKVSYNNWQALRSYMAGDKVTYDNKNWQCVTGHGGLSVPPPNGGLWTQIAGSRMDAGKTITTLANGASLMKVRDFNATYIEAATTTGYQGFVKVADVTATGSSGTRTVPAFNITEQLFTINKIDKETDRHMIRIEAEHISYQLGRTVLGECNVVGVSPATALQFIAGAMQESYTGGLYCGIDDGTVEGDWSWKNAQAAILDPSSGLLKDIDGRIIRDNLDVYMIGNAAEDAVYEIAYGVNMKTVRWTGDVSGIVTRVYPIAQREDGTRITLPEKYIDSVLTVPYIRPEVLDTKLKIGQKVENSDGTEVELTEDEVLTRMRSQAQDRFDVDKCDQAEVTLELDYVHMPDTEEYKDYLSMTALAPAQWVRVINGPMGVDTTIQLTEYTYDPILLKYKTTKYGKKSQKATVAGYNIKSGAVTGRTIASGAVTGANIAAGTITAREIEANAITAEQIASKVITAALIAADAITAEQISTNDLTAIQAKLQIASIADAEIGSASIGYAQIKDASVQNLIARDALTDRYFIDKLQVRNVQAVAATVGELVVKAADNKYYKLNVGTDGSLSATEVTPTAAEITAGVTSDGHGTIIETDLTAQDLAATNIKGINALIDKLNAARINVDELFARTAFINKLNTTNIESTANLKIKAGGTFTVDSGNFSIDSSGNVSMTGTINAGAGGKIAGWDINAASMTGNKTGIAKTTNDADIALWAGNATAGSANFRVTQGGKVTLRDLVVLDEQGNETSVDLRNYPLWKLSYETIKTFTKSESGNSITLTIGTSDGDKSVTFSKAALTAHLVGSWSGNTYTVEADNDPNVLPVSTTLTGSKGTGTTSGTWTIDTFDANHRAYAAVAATGITTGNLFGFNINATSEYNAGVTDGTTAGYNSAKLSGAWNGTQWLVTKGTSGANQVGITLSATIAYSTTTHKYTAKANADGTAIDTVESGTQAYDAGVTAGNTAGYNSAKLAGSFSGATWTVTKGTTGTDSVSLTLSATASISYDSTTHKYTATGKARASNADRASATATSGTEAYDAGYGAGWAAAAAKFRRSGNTVYGPSASSGGTDRTYMANYTASSCTASSYTASTHYYNPATYTASSATQIASNMWQNYVPSTYSAATHYYVASSYTAEVYTASSFSWS